MACARCSEVVVAKGLCRFHYDCERRLAPCSHCVARQYKAGMCRVHYKTKQLGRAHCTFPGCCKKLFFRMQCQYHYKATRSNCSHCGRLGTHCRALCRSCYTSTASTTLPDDCEECHRPAYMAGLCIVHFRQVKILKTCALCSRKRVHKDRCRQHI